MDIAIFVFDDITALDAIGPYEVLSRLPGAAVTFCGWERGEVRTDNRFLGLVADASLDDVARTEILLVPGGIGTRPLMRDEAVGEWIRRVDETSRWTTSVCTGSLVLGGAGLLDGVRATTHWLATDLLESTGAVYTQERVVVEGKVVTAAGVSSGIDMALQLAALECGDDAAQEIQLMIEYDPQPPFDSGSPTKAPPHVLTKFGR